MSSTRIAILAVLAMASLQLEAAEILGLPKAIQMALQHRIEMQSTRLSTQSATLGLSVAESQLGWQANAAAGWKHGLDTFGQETEQQQLSAGLAKQQRSGNQISVQGRYQKDDSETTGSTVFPNPVESYAVNLDYRMPLKKGKDNLEYAYAEAQARSNIAVATAQQQATAEQISEQLIGIYHRLLDIQIQINENDRAIQRTLRLEKFIQKNTRLGLAEAKDRLSVQARLAAHRADEKRLRREWNSQLTELKKMTGTVQASARVTNYENTAGLPPTLGEVLQQVVQRDAAIASNKAKVSLSEALLQLNRNKQKDQLDVVVSLGNETRQGQRSGGALDENEWVGGVRLEYQLPLDRRGVDARTRQSLLEIDQIRLDNQRYENDLKNQLSQWYQEWQMTTETTQQFRQRLKIERLKYNEVRGRYLEGRTDIREMLEAEETLTTAQKLLAKEEARRSLMLALLSNRLGVFTGDDGK